MNGRLVKRPGAPNRDDQVRLLAVDDEAAFLQTLIKRLERRGFFSCGVGTGAEALAHLEKRKVDVVLLDVRLPDINGLDVLTAIKARMPRIEVILLTGQAVTGDGVEGMRRGAFDYLSKPLEIEHLVGKIRQAWQKIQWEQEREKEAEFRSRMQEQMAATERLAALGTLAAGVAHEINNPLAIINDAAGWLKLVLRRPHLDALAEKADFEKGLGKIEQSVARARAITHQLLGFVRRPESVLSEVDMDRLVEESIQMVRREAETKGVRMARCRHDSASVRIWIDPYPLRQVLINLLTNAVHATDPGGEVTVFVEEIGDELLVTVRDNGPGIPQEILGRVFEPFYTTKPPGTGTGLGLFVSKGIVEKMGGALTVSSRLGYGTSACIRLPRTSAGPAGLNSV